MQISLSKLLSATKSLLVLFGVSLLGAFAAAEEPSYVDWKELTPIPDKHGMAGMFAGVSNGHLIAAGGANFPEAPPWEDGTKVWHDSIFVLDLADEQAKWRKLETRLPAPTAYGVSVTYRFQTALLPPPFAPLETRLIWAGGDDGKTPLTRVYSIEWKDDDVQIVDLPALPQPCTQTSGAIVGDTLYIAGGQDSFDATKAMSTFWSLNLKEDDAKWETLETWPGAARMQGVAASAEGHFYLFGGVQLKDDGTGKGTRITPYLKDAFRYSPGSKTWKEVAELPRSLAAAPTPAPVIGGQVYLFGGVDGSLFTADPTTHPGFQHSAYSYNPTIDRWVTRASMPEGTSRVTVPAVQYDDNIYIVSGESRPGIRSPKVFHLKYSMPKRGFGTLNWAVLTAYIVSLVGLGAYFARRERSVDDFFTASGRVPWWAAGLSIFATMLSAITYLAIPAKAYGDTWTTFPLNCGILLIAPIVVFIYLPFFRRLSVASAYEYLEKRFSLGVRIFGSLSFILFQIGRMAIVVLLPALALSAVTGLSVESCIIVIGVLSTLYTVLGGIEAVIWTDVIQTVVLIGGAIWAFFAITSQVDGGLSTVVSTSVEHGKLKLFNPELSFLGDAMPVIVLAILFHNLVPYTSDQAVIQRYLTTKDEKSAGQAIWTNGVLSIFASILFFGLGSALFVFYMQFPEKLAPLGKSDQIVPWFVSQELPPGIAGLVIAGVFAAAMSSLDSSMHSISTAVTTDFFQRFSNPSKETLLKIARIATLILGVVGTVAAMVLAKMNIKELWDFFLGYLGIMGSTLCGLFMLGIFSKKANSTHAWVGIIASVLALVVARYSESVSGYSYSTIGPITCVVAASLAAMVMPGPAKTDGLTIWTRDVS